MDWYDIEKKKPLAIESGGWDGLRSSRLLVATLSGQYHVVFMYEGFLDGADFCNFYDERDWEIENVKYWAEIDSPF